MGAEIGRIVCVGEVESFGTDHFYPLVFQHTTAIVHLLFGRFGEIIGEWFAGTIEVEGPVFGWTRCLYWSNNTL